MHMPQDLVLVHYAGPKKRRLSAGKREPMWEKIKKAYRNLFLHMASNYIITLRDFSWIYAEQAGLRLCDEEDLREYGMKGAPQHILKSFALTVLKVWRDCDTN